MKMLLALPSALILALAVTACGKTAESADTTNITITARDIVFSAKLYDNEATRALLRQFPMTLNMSELNGNEKYYHLAENLPSGSTERPLSMKAGDLMCWSGNSLVRICPSWLH